jgi:hypothetical protein
MASQVGTPAAETLRVALIEALRDAPGPAGSLGAGLAGGSARGGSQIVITPITVVP